MNICGKYLDVKWELKPTINTYYNFLQTVLCRKNKMAASLFLISCPEGPALKFMHRERAR